MVESTLIEAFLLYCFSFFDLTTHYTIPQTVSKSPGVVDYHVWIGRLVDLPALRGANKPPKEQNVTCFLTLLVQKGGAQ